MLLALASLSSSFIWNTFLSDHMSMLSQEPIENSPASIASLIHIVALQHELGRELWDLLYFAGIFILESRFNCLDESHRVTGTTLSLVSHWSREIKVADISKIKCFRHDLIGHFIMVSILLPPEFGSSNCFLELNCILTPFLLARLAILLMLLLQLFLQCFIFHLLNLGWAQP